MSTRHISLLFAMLIGLSALLMFWLQPMVTKLLLPAMGGTPAVWNVAVVLFQSLLLAGYCYAHLLSRIGLKGQLLLHTGLWLAVPAAVWLFGFTFLAERAADHTAYMQPQRWLLITLLGAIGPIFFLLSSTSPLLQHWYHRLPHSKAENPYILYAVSNFGSFAGLAGYLLVIEPWWGLAAQQSLWQWGIGVFMVMLLLVTLPLWRYGTHHTTEEAGDALQEAMETGHAGERLHWLLLAFVPSGLLLAVTQHVTTEIAPMPLLWVVPLALYLLSFTLTFTDKPLLSLSRLLKLQIVFVVPLIFAFYSGLTKGGGVLVLVWHCLAFTITALVCHRLLYEARPHARRLTGFYLLLSLGGVLGGMFTVFVAPQVFDNLLEYPLLLALALACRPRGEDVHQRIISFLPWAVGTFVIMASLPWLMAQVEGLSIMRVGVVLMLNVLALKFLFDQDQRPWRLGSCFAAVVLAGIIVQSSNHQQLFQGRNFFGALTVVKTEGELHRLTHGTTVHGAQYQDQERRFTPLTYFHPTGPLGEVFAQIRTQHELVALRVGIIGLGTGSMACYGSEGDDFTFYEINPMVQMIAENPAWFSFLEGCPPAQRTILGDARIMLRTQEPADYHLFILDAFNSDAIPVHLVTEEAFQLYAAHLAEGGIIAAHISNRYVDLPEVLAGIARHTALTGYVKFDEDDSQDAQKKASLWVVLARDASTLDAFSNISSGWRPLDAHYTGLSWTDDYSNLVRVLKVQ